MYTNHGWLPLCKALSEFHLGAIDGGVEIRVYVSGPFNLCVIIIWVYNIICTVILTPQNRLHGTVTLTCANLSATHKSLINMHPRRSYYSQNSDDLIHWPTYMFRCLPSKWSCKEHTSSQDSENRNRPSISEKIMDTHVTQMLEGKDSCSQASEQLATQTSVDYRGPSRCRSSYPTCNESR